MYGGFIHVVFVLHFAVSVFRWIVFALIMKLFSVLADQNLSSRRELYSFFIEHMQAIQSLSIFAKTPEERSELSCASAMFGLVEAVIYAAGTGTDQKCQINVSEQEEDNRNVALASLLLNWSHVTGFLPLIVGCVTKWIKEILECNKFEIQVRVELKWGRKLFPLQFSSQKAVMLHVSYGLLTCVFSIFSVLMILVWKPLPSFWGCCCFNCILFIVTWPGELTL